MARFLCLPAVLFLMMSAVLAAPAGAGTVALPQTGQTACYDSAGTVVPCQGTGQDGELRAGVLWPDPRFIDHGLTLTDALTGLTWLKNTNCMLTSYPDFDQEGPREGKVNWGDALSFVDGINAGTYPDCGAGYDDWRLPNVNELETLVNAQVISGVWLSAQGFTNHLNVGWWSATTSSAFFPVNGVFVDLHYHMVANTAKSDGGLVLPVRGGQLSGLPDPAYPANVWRTGQTVSLAAGDDGDLRAGVAWPVPRFTDPGDGAVTDVLTGLAWLKDANCIATWYPAYAVEGRVSWQRALDFITGINAGSYPNCGAGYDDWRLPNRRELLSLMDRSEWGPALPAGHPFQNAPAGPEYYWSSTSYANDPSRAWYLYVRDGDLGIMGKGSALFAWPVRGQYSQPPAEPDIHTVPAQGFDFGKIGLGSDVSQEVTIANAGGLDLSVTSMRLSGSGDFFLYTAGGSTPCGSAPFDLLPSQSCTIVVWFSPTTVGGMLGAFLDIASNDPDEPELRLTFYGSGDAPPPEPDITATPDAAEFGTVALGGASLPQVITLANAGSATLNISDIGLTITPNPAFVLEQYAVENPCGMTLALEPGQSCNVMVTFQPTEEGLHQYAVRVLSDDPDTAVLLIPLTGTCVPPVIGPDILVSPLAVTFALAPPGRSPMPEVLTIANVGDMRLVLSIPTLSDPDDFAMDRFAGPDPCWRNSAWLEAGDSCTMEVMFTPRTPGVHQATLTIPSSDPEDGTVVVDLEGEARTFTTPVPEVALVPDHLGFPNTRVDRFAEPLVLRVKNVGAVPAWISEITLVNQTHDACFALDLAGGGDPCGSAGFQLAPGESCTASVGFHPPSAQEHYGRVNVDYRPVVIDPKEPFATRSSAQVEGEGELEQGGAGDGGGCFGTVRVPPSGPLWPGAAEFVLWLLPVFLLRWLHHLAGRPVSLVTKERI